MVKTFIRGKAFADDEARHARCTCRRVASVGLKTNSASFSPVGGSPHPLPDLLEAQPVAARWGRPPSASLRPWPLCGGGAGPVSPRVPRVPGPTILRAGGLRLLRTRPADQPQVGAGPLAAVRLISTGCGSDTSALPRSDRRTFPDTDDACRRPMAPIRQRGTRRELVVRRALVSYTPGSAKRRPEPGGDGDAEFDPVPTGTSWRRGAEPFD
jgi:hypothetical protein